MLRSMYSAVSGLRSHQTKMDVIGNNIANVNTPGFKSSRATFKDVFSQMIRGAAAPEGGRGGINPQQIGLGVDIGSIDTDFGQGSLETTGKATDLAIEGSGFFVVSDGARNYYTRLGSFDLDRDGSLVNTATGYIVQGYRANNSGQIVQTLTDLSIPIGQEMPAVPTANVGWSYNLDATAPVGTVYNRDFEAIDSRGVSHTIQITFTKTLENEWDWQIINTTLDSGGSGTIQFDAFGTASAGATGSLATTPVGANQLNITLDFSTVTQRAGETSISATSRDGHEAGSLDEFIIDKTGTITGIFSNNLTRVLGKVAVATFSNPGGLQKAGNSCYFVSNNSGMPIIGPAGTGGRGTITPGSLEMSNVDLARQFTEMIVAQRGFQANSRTITAADEMLQELVNLKR